MNLAWTNDGIPVACEFAAVQDRQAWPRLENDEIHVWKACLSGADHESHLEMISPDERVRAGRYRFERDRQRFVTGRAILRRILGGYLGRSPRDLSFLHGAHGKPRLAMNHWMDSLHFNVSHTDSIALYAVARGGAVGIDIERIREIPDWSDIADIFFVPAEQESLRNLAADRRHLAFLQAWTRQEALLKVSGDGLVGENDGRVSARESGLPVHSFTPAPGYLAALASGFSAQRMSFMTWSPSPARSALQDSEHRNNLT